MPINLNDPNARAQLAARHQGLKASLVGQSDQAVLAMAVRLVGALKQVLSTPGRSGRFVKSRGITSRLKAPGTKGRLAQLHQISAVGDPPAPDTGQLRASIGFEKRRSVVRVGTGLPQAPRLNYALRRPFMEPALKRVRAEMTRAGVAVLQQVKI